jgi:hypothetical protein
MVPAVKIPAFLLAVLMACLAAPASGQRDFSRGAQHHHGNQAYDRQMPPAERRMGWEERQRLREQVRNGQMTRDEARARWREQRAADPHRFSREQHEQLRRDVQEANREIRRGR